MATRPKRRKRTSATIVSPEDPPSSSAVQPDPSTPLPTSMMENMVSSCLAAITPTLKETVQQCIKDFHDKSEQETSSAADSQISLLEELTTPPQGGRIQSSVSFHGQRTHPSPTGVSSSLSATTNMLLQNSLSQSTIVSYQSAFQSYKQFLVQTFGEQVQLLPPSVQHMSAFIAHCFQSNLAASTTRTLISSLSFIFKLGDFSDVTQHFIIKKMLQGYQKCKPSMDARLPITPLILGKLVNALEHTTSSPFVRALLRAMFILAFCAFLRVGEITKTGNANQHFLKFGDICVSQDVRVRKFIDVNIPHFKHSKSHHTTLRLQENTSTPYLCPYQAVVRYLDLRKHSSCVEPLFSFLDGKPITRHYFTQQMQAALSFCDLNLHNYHTHSFRIGAASTAAAKGFTELQIQTMGRWNSNAFRKYIRIPTLQL